MPDTYADLFDDNGSSNIGSPIITSTHTQIAQGIQYQFDPNLDEKDFFELSYGKEYGWLKLSDGKYAINQKNSNGGNDLILHDGTKEICRIENIFLLSQKYKEIVNGKTWLYVKKDSKLNSSDSELLVNRICVDNLEQYSSKDYRFKNVTGIVHVCKKDPSHNNSEIAYFLTDHGFPKSFFERFLDLGENFHEVIENGLPKFEAKDLYRIFIESGEYKDQYFVVRIENGSPEYIPGKIISTENISMLHDSLIIIERDGIKNLHSMRLGSKAIYTNIDHIETEVLSGEKAMVKIIIHLPDDTIITRIAQYGFNGIYEIANTK